MYSWLKVVHTRFSSRWSPLFHPIIRQRFGCLLSLSLAVLLAKSVGRAVRKMCSHIPEKKLDTQKRGPTAERGWRRGSDTNSVAPCFPYSFCYTGYNTIQPNGYTARFCSQAGLKPVSHVKKRECHGVFSWPRLYLPPSPLSARFSPWRLSISLSCLIYPMTRLSN